MLKGRGIRMTRLKNSVFFIENVFEQVYLSASSIPAKKHVRIVPDTSRLRLRIIPYRPRLEKISTTSY